MSRRRFGRAIFNTLLLLVAAWLTVVALFLLVPSPLPNDINQDGSSKLRNGEPLTRVYRIQDFFQQTGQFHGRTHVILTFHWFKDSQTLSLSPTSSVRGIDKANVTVLDAPIGDENVVSLPYFAKADIVILFSVVRNYGPLIDPEYGTFPLTTRVLDTPHQNQTVTEFSILAAEFHSFTPLHTPPLITIGYSTVDYRLTSVHFPLSPSSCLAPSQTIQVRMILMRLIAPVAILGFLLISTARVFLEIAISLLQVLLGLVFASVMTWQGYHLFRTFRSREIESGEGADNLVMTQEERTPIDEEAAPGSRHSKV